MRKKWNSVFFAVLFSLLFFELLIGFPVHTERAEPLEESLESLGGDSLAEKRFDGVHLVETKEGRQDWELFADSAESFEAINEWRLEHVKVQLYKQNKLQFTIVGNKGKVNTSTKNLEVHGDVTTTSSNGYVFTSPSIFYVADNRKLFTRDPVRMKSPRDEEGQNLEIKGIGMETFVDEQVMRIQSQVRARRGNSSAQELEIQSSQAEFSSFEHKAQFSGKVEVKAKAVLLEAPFVDLRYATGTQTLQSLEAKGGVKLSDSNKFATAESIFFQPRTNEFRLVGRPRVVQDQDEILGEEIALLDGGKRIRVDKIRAHVERLNSEGSLLSPTEKSSAAPGGGQAP